jgi:hypothetical protein
MYFSSSWSASSSLISAEQVQQSTLIADKMLAYDATVIYSPGYPALRIFRKSLW